MRKSVRRKALALAAAVAPLFASPAAPEEEPEPKDLGLVEHATARLAQIDVSVDGPREVVATLTEKDFYVRVGGKKLDRFVLDRLCAAPPSRGEPKKGGKTPAVEPPVEPPPPVRATYLFYFDHPHLTAAGRQAAIEAARVMIPRLVVDGSRGMLVSNAVNLRTLQPMTEDPDVLLAALTRMEKDPLEWDPYSAQEEVRLSDVLDALSEDTDRALVTARRFQQDERWRQERNLRRLGMTLGTLSEYRPPKAFVYFADTMRANAGEHYLSFFGSSALAKDPEGTRLARAESEMGALPLDRVIDEASALGVRFYTVEAQGLTATGNPLMARRPIGSPGRDGLNSSRIRDAQGTLKDMALETGGEAFLNGVPAGRMTDRILEDVSCLYLLSFDPTGFPTDEPLAVRVEVDRPKVKLQTRGRLVLASETSRVTTRLLSRFASPEAVKSDVALRVGIAPVGFRDGKYVARIQVAVPPTPFPGTKWDLGASLVARGAVRDETSARIEVAQSGVPVVLEREMSFRPGPFEIVAVAYESTTDQTASARLEGEWPPPNDDLVSFGPVSVSQSAKGAFYRDGTAVTSGVLLHAPEEPLRPDLPTAFLGLVCRAEDQKRAVRVVRKLVGLEEVPVGDTEVEFAGERCVQVLDVLRPGTLGPGGYRYVLEAFGAHGRIAAAERRFVAAEIVR